MARVILMTGDGEAVAIDDSKKLGKGGEGSVYAVQSPARFSQYCIKEYLPAILADADKMAERQAKIEYMVAHPVVSPDPNIVICWPAATIYRDGRFVGFMMLRAFEQSRELEWFVSYNLRKVILQTPFRSFDGSNGFVALYNRIVVANNLAFALHLIHSSNRYVLADTKPKNILITSTGNVSIVDLDSVQIVIDGVLRFKAPVASPNYKPPEGHDGRLSQESDIIPVSWDRFSYAVMAYELIIGSHPYGVGTYQAPYNQGDDTLYKIRTGLFLHGHKSAYLVARHDESLMAIKARWNALPEALRLLFMLAFEKAQFKPEMRPSMVEWGQGLSASILAFEPDEVQKIAAANAQRQAALAAPPAIPETTAGVPQLQLQPQAQPKTAPQASPSHIGPSPVSAPSPSSRLPSHPALSQFSIPIWLVILGCVLGLVHLLSTIVSPPHTARATAHRAPATVPSVAPVRSANAAKGTPPPEMVSDGMVVSADEMIYAPVLAVGMAWQMQRTDFDPVASPLQSARYRITAINDNSVQVEKQPVPSGVLHTITPRLQLGYDKSWNPLNGEQGSFAPALAYYDFPLKVGKTWSNSSSVSNNPQIDVISSSGIVQGWQMIQTPAGKFRALKVEVILNAYRAGVLTTTWRHIAWYADSVMHVVRSEDSVWDSGDRAWRATRTEELTAASGVGR